MNKFVMFDINHATGEEYNHMFVDGLTQPEKIYSNHVDHYGDIRDSWRVVSSSFEYETTERPLEPANESEDIEQWMRVLAWEESRADYYETRYTELLKRECGL